jgi:hypothetical protein
MTTLRSISPKRGVLGVAAAAAVLSIAAPVAGASSGGVDPAVYDSGVPAGTVEHGVESFTVTGSTRPSSERVEYWVSASRFREQTTDVKTGKLIAARVHDASGTTSFSANGPAGHPLVEHFAGNDSIPGPGWPAPYNKKLLAGTTQRNATHSWRASLAPIGPVTIAQIAGTKYELMTNGHPEQATSKGTQHTYLTLDADAKPLQRETTTPNGKGAAFDQLETLLSRETLSPSAATSHISRASFRASIKSWKAKAAKAERTARKHH